ncbi:MAG: hypothetical protein JO013_04320 [Alphaproteobacteria bacterium]|nr:hypothetical protein [Alphaproteobacteria bacterium]
MRGLAGAAAAICIAAAAAPALAALPAPAPAPPVVAADADLRTIAESLLPASVMHAMIEQGVDVVLRTKREKDPEWQAMERDFPGLSDATLDATRRAALAELPGMMAALHADAVAFFAARLTASERAGFAAYLRRPYPQRMARMALVARPGETVVQALTRAVAAAEASATAEDRRQEELFYASPLGRKCNAVAAEYAQQRSARQGEIVTPILKAALTKGTEAGLAFLQARSPH